MSVAPSVQDFVDDFTAQPPRLRLSSPLTDVKFIGSYYAAQMRNHASHSARTVRDLIRHTANMTLPQVRQLLAEYVRNRNANSCVRAANGERYHVRDFSFVSFNSLRNLLAAARVANVGRFGHAARLPAEFQNKRDASTALCSCRQTQATCEAAGVANCRWRPLAAPVQGRAGVCQPVQRRRQRGGRTIGVAFPGIRRNEPGQRKSRANQQADANQTFVGLWRVPEN